MVLRLCNVGLKPLIRAKCWRVASTTQLSSRQVSTRHIRQRNPAARLGLPLSPSRARNFATSARCHDEGKDSEVDALASLKRHFSLPAASIRVSDVSTAQVGQEVVLHGYLGSRNDMSKNLSFVPLRSHDLRYNIQIISKKPKTPTTESLNSHEALRQCNQHTPVAVRGVIRPRQPSKGAQTGDVEHNNEHEIELREITALNEFPRDLEMTDETNFPPEQRHLQLRNTKALRDALAFRSKAVQVCRDQLSQDHFLEVETPLLFKSTPEGAREFLVPTRDKGMVYALPQSPQQYKQILMASGIPRYFQFARCFRDEDQRADRQPEFTQLDLEMSFSKGEQVMQIIEVLLRRLWKDMLGVEVSAPFRRMPYQEALSRYGSDKPDLRFGMELTNVGELLPADLISKIGPHIDPDVDAFKIHVSDNPRETKKFIGQFLDSVDGAPFTANPDGQPGIFIYDSSLPLDGLQPLGFQTAEYMEEQMKLEDGDLIVLQARQKGPFNGGSTMAGRLRLALHKAAVAQELIDPPTGYEFLWVTDFPLFTSEVDAGAGQGGAAGFSSTHHPFTAPKTVEDIDLLTTDPTAAKADHYDIVVNGVELGGGSRRIHDARAQEFILKNILKMSDERLKDFSHLLEVLRAGCPPHAGIALGFDRLIAVMLGKESIRDVIAFPKTGKGEDHLVKSPSRITEGQLATYHLRLRD